MEPDNKKQPGAELTPKQLLADIYTDMNWKPFAEHYFHHTAGWLYNKFDRRDVNRNNHLEDFTPEQLLKLKQSLYDYAERIKRAADNL